MASSLMYPVSIESVVAELKLEADRCHSALPALEFMVDAGIAGSLPEEPWRDPFAEKVVVDPVPSGVLAAETCHSL